MATSGAALAHPVERSAPSAAPAPDCGKAAVGTPVSQPAYRAPNDSPTTGLRLTSYVSLGVGVVGLAVGTGFALRAANRNEEALRLCQTTDPTSGAQMCTNDNELQRWRHTSDESSSARTLSQIGFVTGAVGLVTGAVLFLVSGRDEQPAPPLAKPLELEPVVGLSFVGVAGRF